MSYKNKNKNKDKKRKKPVRAESRMEQLLKSISHTLDTKHSK